MIINTLEELQDFLADYQPEMSWKEYRWFAPGYSLTGFDPEKFKPEFFNALVERVLKEKGNDPIKASYNYIMGFLSSWGKESLECAERKSHFREKINPIEKSDEIFRFQCGTSLHRAQHFLKNGMGYVMLENAIGPLDRNIVDRYFGLQVSEIGNHCRSEWERLHYYAYSQRSRTAGDKPVVLIGEIDSSHVYNEINLGEYAISRADYGFIKNAEIISLEEYQERF